MEWNSELRQAVSQDIPFLIEICAGSFPNSLRWNGPTRFLRRWWKSALASASCEIWVETARGEIACFAILILDPDRWRVEEKNRSGGAVIALLRTMYSPRIAARHLHSLFLTKTSEIASQESQEYLGVDAKKMWVELLAVAGHFRGAGHAQHIMSMLEVRALSMGGAAIGLSAENNNKAARKLYERLGYRKKTVGALRTTWEKRL